MDKATQYSDTHVRMVLWGLLATDLVLTTIGYGFPGLWFALIHGTPYDDPEGLLRRCAGNWLMFGVLQALALGRWKREPGWLAVVSGARFSDVLTDWSYLWFSTHRTWLGALGLFAAGPLNLLCGVYLWRAYACAARVRTGPRLVTTEPLVHGRAGRPGVAGSAPLQSHAEGYARVASADWGRRTLSCQPSGGPHAQDVQVVASVGGYSGENPAVGIEPFPAEKRDRFVQPHELPQLFEALREEPSPYMKTAFLVALLTGARRGEVLAMRWEDLDLAQALWRIPQTKANHPHYLPLPQSVVAMLQALPRLHESPYVFPGRDGHHHLVNIAKAWMRVRARAGLTDVRLHDLQRTLGSWLVAHGASLPLIGKALDHSQVATTAIYARLQLDPVRVALESNAQRMLSVGENVHASPEHFTD